PAAAPGARPARHGRDRREGVARGRGACRGGTTPRARAPPRTPPRHPPPPTRPAEEAVEVHGDQQLGADPTGSGELAALQGPAAQLGQGVGGALAAPAAMTCLAPPV